MALGYVILNPIVFAAIVLLPAIFMGLAGFLVERTRVGYLGRTIGDAIRVGEPLQVLLGHDRKMRIFKMLSGVTGYWHHKYVEQIPDEKGTYNLGGASIGFGAAQSVANVNSEFLAFIGAWRKAAKEGKFGPVANGGNGMVDILGHEVGETPDQLARAIYELEDQYQAVSERIKWVDKIGSNQTTTQEAVRDLKLDRDAAKKFEDEVDEAMKDVRPWTPEEQRLLALTDDALKAAGKLRPQREVAYKLRERLKRIEKARKVTVEESGFTLMKDVGGKAKLVRITEISLDDFWDFMPSGSDISKVWTMIKRAALQDKLESGFDEGKGFKWLIIGIVVMMVTIGTGVMVYLITKG